MPVLLVVGIGVAGKVGGVKPWRKRSTGLLPVTNTRNTLERQPEGKPEGKAALAIPSTSKATAATSAMEVAQTGSMEPSQTHNISNFKLKWAQVNAPKNRAATTTPKVAQRPSGLASEPGLSRKHKEKEKRRAKRESQTQSLTSPPKTQTDRRTETPGPSTTKAIFRKTVLETTATGQSEKKSGQDKGKTKRARLDETLSPQGEPKKPRLTPAQDTRSTTYAEAASADKPKAELVITSATGCKPQASVKRNEIQVMQELTRMRRLKSEDAETFGKRLRDILNTLFTVGKHTDKSYYESMVIEHYISQLEFNVGIGVRIMKPTSLELTIIAARQEEAKLMYYRQANPDTNTVSTSQIRQKTDYSRLFPQNNYLRSVNNTPPRLFNPNFVPQQNNMNSQQQQQWIQSSLPVQTSGNIRNNFGHQPNLPQQNINLTQKVSDIYTSN
ncbi:unnamed protein product [Leptidea sinapis]|uniref:Uncharacterized protein n=1 Tax=Leptidea sinapis TaxID=189913 RepID=A0A5E4PXQ7_9NEOP|nr:unnamed protein product [Leptidea sinapis]